MVSSLKLLIIACVLAATCAFHGTSVASRAMNMHRSRSASLTMAAEIKAQLTTDMKEAMKAKDKQKLAAVRAIQTAIKQKEVDERIEVDDDMTIAIMSKLIKQRKESIKSYTDGGRKDLADAEQIEVDFISAYLPAQMSDEELTKLIEDIVVKLGASTIKDMGKVMAEVRPLVVGKADAGEVGAKVKARLNGK